MNRKIIRGWAAFDLSITGLLALPFTAEIFVVVLYAINGLLGGSETPPPFQAIHWLFVCFTGGLGVLWALARLFQPSAFLSKADVFARLWMTCLLLYFIFVRHAAVALLLFVASELIGALHQLWSLQRAATKSTPTR